MIRLRASRFGGQARLFLLLLSILGAASTLEAQTQKPPPKPALVRPAPAQQPRIALRGYITFGTSRLAANETFEAVAEPQVSAIGGGVQVTNVWRNAFADVAGSQLSLDGERVFIDNGRIFELGIPLEIAMRPFDIAGGWRLALMRGRIFPYIGAGLTIVQYEETSEFAGSGEDVSESKAGPLVIGGVDVGVWRWISAGGEFRWRRVRGILGERGASAEFGEDDAGGFNAGVRISVRLPF
jgi:hypothetical protein